VTGDRPAVKTMNDKQRLARVTQMIRAGGGDDEDQRWLQGIFDHAMALRRIARGKA